MKKFFEDFKAFAMKGNVVDMAVGVIIGGAFGKIVSSFVADIITPLLGILLGKVSFTDLKWVITPAVLDEAGNVVEAELALTYGNFIQQVIDFLIIALSIFVVLRVIMAIKSKFEKKQEEIVFTEEFAFTSKEPSVKFRGFFMNDEWPSLGNFVMNTFGDFNVKFYDKVFDLLLRLKGNYFWPAMWSASLCLDGSEEDPLANVKLATDLGITIGNSHHEPLMRSSEAPTSCRLPPASRS